MAILFQPCNIPIHPVLQELPASRTNVAILIKESIFGMNIRFRLAECRHIEAGEDIAEMLLSQRGAHYPN